MRNINRRYGKRYKNIIISHVQHNLKEYIIIGIIFIIGILLGIVFVNNLNEVQTEEIDLYITSSITALKENKDINELQTLQDSIKNNIIVATLLWLMGSTVIGLLLVYLIVCFKGFCFGYFLCVQCF